jgi:rhodanese-related sulfurtransferase
MIHGKKIKFSSNPVFFAIFPIAYSVFVIFLVCSPTRGLSAEETLKLTNSGNESLLIIDLRDITEYSKGHIKGAVNIPYRGNTFPARISTVSDKNKILIIYCGKGVKTGKAEEFIKKSSFKKKYILEGGFKEWREKGFPIEQ